MTSIIDSPLFSLVDASKYGQLRECVAYIEKARSTSIDISHVLNVTDESGNTPLHWAAYKKHHDIVKYLLSMGANPNATNSDEAQTPLHWACIGGDAYIVKSVVNSGGDCQQVDKRGYNALVHATQYNELKIARYLIERSLVNVSSPDHLMQTALHWAAYQGHMHIMLYLVNKGADIDAVDSYGRLPLHWACYKGHRDAARTLCDFGSDLFKKDNEGNTPVDLAKQQNHAYLAAIISTHPYHPLRKMGRISYNLLWIMVAIGLYCTFAFSLYYFRFIISLFALAMLMATCKLILEPMVLPYTSNPILPTWMIMSFSNWILFYLNNIMKAFPNIIFTHIITICILSSYYYYAFKCFFSDPGIISPASSFQDSKDFLTAVENETKLPEVCSTCLIHKPLRARHCRTCRRCVARFDHHCGWINNCVGVGNNLSFIILLVLFTISYSTSMIFNFNYLALDIESPSITSIISYFTYHYLNNKALLVYMVYETIIMAWIGKLMWVQVTGMLNNVTMFEMMRPPAPTGEQGKACAHGHSHAGGNSTDNNSSGHNGASGASESPSHGHSHDSPSSSSSSSTTSSRPRVKPHNPYDKGSWKANTNEFIYESSKWFRYFNHKVIDF